MVIEVLFELENNPLVKTGLSYIGRSMLVYVGGCLLILSVPFLLDWIRGVESYDDLSVDIGVLMFVWLDICILLLLVCQERGLCRSMLLPVFLLIPIAYMTVENPDKRHRILIVLGMIVSGMIITFYLADRTSFSILTLLPTFLIYALVIVLLLGIVERRAEWKLWGAILILALITAGTIIPYPLRNTQRIKGLYINTTDFHTNAHYRYDIAIFLVSLLSVLIPLMQTITVIYQRRNIRRSAVVGTSTPEPRPAQ